MKTAIIIHGTLGSPAINWFVWLKDQLEKQDITVWLPQLPNAEKPSLRTWADFVHNECPFEIDEHTLIVGHSSGAILSLIIAQESQNPIGKIIAVSVFHNNSLEWEPNAELFDVIFDWDAIQRSCQELLFIHSDDDPYVPLDQAQYVADNCRARLVLLSGQGHFNLEKSEQYREFPKLLELL